VPGRFRILKSASRDEALRGWVAFLTRFDEARAQTLKRDDAAGVAVLRTALGSTTMVVKRTELRGLWSRAKALLGHGRGARHWRGAGQLARVGIETGRPLLAALEQHDAGWREWLVVEHVPGSTLLELLAAADASAPGAPEVRAQHALAAEVGAQVAALVRARRFNRDHKPSNLVVRDASADAARVAVIDCVAIRPLPRGGPLAGAARMFASCVIEPAARDCAPRRTLRARAVVEFAHAFLGERAASLPPDALKGLRRRVWTLSEAAFHGRSAN
jgi:hypothetical protein